MLRYTKIRSDLFLVLQDVAPQLTSSAPKAPKGDGTAPVSHIWIYDRSGSMYGQIRELVADLVDKVQNELKSGDTVTVGWFSGEGDFDFIVKGYSISDAKSRSNLVDMLNRNASVRNTTCFSEILHRTADVVIQDLAAINNNFALCFFTDGYPVVNNYQKEIQQIHAAINKLNGNITSAVLVGYGHYYNKELMSEMAARLGGSLVHSSVISEFSASLSELVSDARETGGKQVVVLDQTPLDAIAFSITGRRINLLPVNGKEVSYAPYLREKAQNVFFLTDRVPAGCEEFDLEAVDPTAKADPLTRGAYAASLLFTQRTKTDIAIDILGKIGDVHLVDALTNAFTNSEYGVAEQAIKGATIKPAKRFLKGKVLGYVPPEDAFSLLDAMNLLINDSEASFYPGLMNYKRIGRKAVAISDQPEFVWEDGVSCPISDLVWNDKYLNLSVRAFIRGTVELGEGYKQLGLQKKFPTHIYRNYAIVKDGHVNIPELPISCSEESFETLRDNKLIDDSNPWKKGGVYTLKLEAVPLVNRKTARAQTSAKVLCSKALEELRLEGKIKALKYVRDKVILSTPVPRTTFSPAQEEFLAKHCIGVNGFQPKTEREEAVDFYDAIQFTIGIKGCSSLPKVEDVINKISAGKALKPSEEIVKAGIDLWENSGLKKMSSAVQGAWFDDTLLRLNKELKEVRRSVVSTKFAVILGKVSFDEFTSRENMELDLDGFHFTINVKETRIAI